MPTSFGDPNKWFNARFIPPAEVAKTFVPNDHFWKLCEPSNTLLVGTRGSGKTTLLKMLTYKALRQWPDERANHTRRSLPFRAVYIPTDIQWERELSALQVPGSSHLVLEAAVTANAFHAFAEALQDALEEELTGSPPGRGRDPEAELAQACVRHWQLPPTRANLDGVKLTLLDRLSEIASFARRLRDASDDAQPEPPNYFYLDLLRALVPVCVTFEEMCPPSRDRRWALCFDELEIAPRWLQENLLNKLRGSSATTQRFLFKLCTSPTPAWPKQRIAYEKMDFQVVPLASDDQTDQEFSRELAVAVILRHTGHRIAPEKFFGMSSFAEPPQRGRAPSGYEEGSDALTLFTDLSQYDAAFSELLKTRGIDLADLSTMSTKTRQDVLRKAKPIALLRREYSQRGARAYGTLKEERRQRLGTRLRPTSRRVANVYHGWDVICRAGEGNPRWLMTSLMLLLKKVRQRDLDRCPVIKERDQALVMGRLSDQFANYLVALGELSLKRKEPAHHIWTMLDHVGHCFHNRLTSPARFPLDPPGSFTVDARVLRTVVEKLRTAEFEGAIVDPAYGPDFTTTDSVRGRRFRLSYRLAPKFGLLLRRCKSVPLAQLLDTDPVLKQYCSPVKQPDRRPKRTRTPASRAGRTRRPTQRPDQPTLPYVRRGRR